MTGDKKEAHYHPLMQLSSRRLHMLLLLMVGYFCMALDTSNIGITLSCMVNSTAIAMHGQDNENVSLPVTDVHELNNTQSCSKLSGGVVNDYGGSYDWSVKMQGNIVGATFFGGLVATIPSGWAIDHHSVRHLLLLSVLLLSISSLLLPLAAETVGPIAVVALRFTMGIGEGMMIPGLNGMITRWIPLQEKSTAASLFTAGNQLAGIIGNPVSATLCDSTFRWPAVFYLSGFLGLLWLVAWQWTVNNSPTKSRWISEKEKDYLEIHVAPKNKQIKKRAVPWRSMLTSPAFLSLVYCSIMGNMMLALILVYIPVYFKDVLLLDVKQNGFSSAIPHFVNLSTKLIWGFLMDYLKRKRIITPTQSCKLSQGICGNRRKNNQIFTNHGLDNTMTIISLCFVSLAFFVDCSTPNLALGLFCTLCGGFGLSISGFLTSLLSISPNFIGVVSSINQLIGFGGRLATPQLITHFKTIGTAEEWRGILLVYAVMSMLSAIVFVIWGSGDVQSWDSESETSEKEQEMIDKKALIVKDDVQILIN